MDVFTDEGIRLILIIARWGASVDTEAFMSQYRCPGAQLTSCSTPGYLSLANATCVLAQSNSRSDCLPAGWIVHA